MNDRLKADVLAIFKDRFAVTGKPQLKILEEELSRLDSLMQYQSYNPDEVALQLSIYIMAQFLMQKVLDDRQ